MYLGYHNIEIKTRDILKLNFGIWMIDCMKHGLYVKPAKFFTKQLKFSKFFSGKVEKMSNQPTLAQSGHTVKDRVCEPSFNRLGALV